MFGRGRVAKLALSSLLLSPAHGLRLYPALSTTRLRGGSSSFAMSATATVEAAPAAPIEKFRLDYAAPPYAIDTVHLDFHIAEEETLVKTRLEIKRAAGVADGTPMVLDGDAEVRGRVSHRSLFPPETGERTYWEALPRFRGCKRGAWGLVVVVTCATARPRLRPRVSLPISMHPPIQAVQLREITLDGAPLVEAEDYTLTDETLTLLRPPAGARP